MKIKTSATFFLATLLISCSNPTESFKELAVLDLSQDLSVKSELTLSQLANDISYIKLESKQGYMIGKIDKYSVSENYILVYDKKQEKILLFGKDGRFLRQISQSGKGPGEYFYPYDVRIANNQEFILIHFANKVLRYGFDGNFLGETTLLQGANYVDSFDEGLVAFYSSFKAILMENYSIAFYDFDGTLTGQLGKRNWDRLERGFPVRRPMFYYLDNELHFHEHYYDTVYAVNENRQLVPRISIIRNYSFDHFRQPRNSMDILDFQLDVWMEMPDYIFINGPYKNMMHPLYLDKSTGKLFHVPFDKELKTFGIPNDLDGGAPFWPSIYQDGKVFSFRYSYQMKSVLDNDLIKNANYKNETLRDKLIAFQENLNEDDGPILIKISLK